MASAGRPLGESPPDHRPGIASDFRRFPCGPADITCRSALCDALPLIRGNRGRASLGLSPRQQAVPRDLGAFVSVEYNVGDQVRIGAGPLVGTVGRVVSIDVASAAAQVEVEILHQGRMRHGIVVAELNQLRRPAPSHSTTAATRNAVARDEVLQTILVMHSVGDSVTQIARATGVSKQAVMSLLEGAQP